MCGRGYSDKIGGDVNKRRSLPSMCLFESFSGKDT